MSSKREPTDLKLFAAVETTIVGTLDFVVRYLYTTSLVLLRPSRLFSQPYRMRVTRPWTYLALTSFGTFYFGLELLRHVFYPTYYDSTRNLILELRSAYEGVSLKKLLELVLPFVFVLAVLSHLLAWMLTPKPVTRRRIMHAICYASGCQMLVILALSVSLAVWLRQYSGHYKEEAGIRAFVIVVFFFVPAVLAVPVNVVLRIVKLPRFGWRDWFPWIRLTLVVLLIAPVAPFAYFAAQIAYERLSYGAAPEGLQAVCATSTVANEMLRVNLIITNAGSKTQYVGKSSNGLSARLGPEPLTFESAEREYTIESWADGASPVLVVESGETKWITLVVNTTPEDSTMLQDGDFTLRVILQTYTDQDEYVRNWSDTYVGPIRFRKGGFGVFGR